MCVCACLRSLYPLPLAAFHGFYFCLGPPWTARHRSPLLGVGAAWRLARVIGREDDFISFHIDAASLSSSQEQSRLPQALAGCLTLRWAV